MTDVDAVLSMSDFISCNQTVVQILNNLMLIYRGICCDKWPAHFISSFYKCQLFTETWFTVGVQSETIHKRKVIGRNMSIKVLKLMQNVLMKVIVL